MGRIYLIRHGETDSNKHHKFQGSMDLPLNAKGLAQAEKLSRSMKEVNLDAIYSSSMLRASMTASRLALSKNMSYRCLDLLREISFGDWEDMEFAEITKRWPEEMDNFLTSPGKWQPPNGESFAKVRERCEKAFDCIFKKEGHDRNIAIVSHGGIIRVQLCMILGMDLDNLWRICVHNVSVSTVSDWNGRLIVENINVV